MFTSISLTLRCCNTDSAICSLLLQLESQGRRPTPNWFFGTSLGSEPVALWAAWTSWHNHSFFKVRHLQRTTTLIHTKIETSKIPLVAKQHPKWIINWQTKIFTTQSSWSLGNITFFPHFSGNGHCPGWHISGHRCVQFGNFLQQQYLLISKLWFSNIVIQ